MSIPLKLKFLNVIMARWPRALEVAKDLPTKNSTWPHSYVLCGA